MIRFTALGWRQWAEHYVRQAKSLHLFTGDATDPQQLTEIAGAGYAPIVLLGGGWTYRELPGLVSASYPEVTFKFDAALETEVTGYFARNADGQVIFWEPAFADEPFRVRARRRLGVEVVIDVATDH